MKKIYLLAIASILMLSTGSAFAQSCQGTAFARNFNIASQCVVFVQNMPGNAVVVLTDVNLDIISSATTTADGFAVLPYSCDRVPAKVSALLGGCVAIVPPQAVLPIKLSAFNAELKGNNTVLLKWVSSLELSSFKYVVQKSNDGLNFSDIGSVPAAGNSDKPLGYSFEDKDFVSGASFFRLKQVDIDGQVEYSKIVYVNNKSTSG
ncbi:MAG: hypothetical protein H7Y03_07875, partial [Chitinophagaceae bacterium]|nr:hypothetical protein [Chitinophagaceae bacterium]